MLIKSTLKRRLCADLKSVTIIIPFESIRNYWNNPRFDLQFWTLYPLVLLKWYWIHRYNILFKYWFWIASKFQLHVMHVKYIKMAKQNFFRIFHHSGRSNFSSMGENEASGSACRIQSLSTSWRWIAIQETFPFPYFCIYFFFHKFPALVDGVSTILDQLVYIIKFWNRKI